MKQVMGWPGAAVFITLMAAVLTATAAETMYRWVDADDAAVQLIGELAASAIDPALGPESSLIVLQELAAELLLATLGPLQLGHELVEPLAVEVVDVLR